MATGGLRFELDGDGRLRISSSHRRVVWLRLLPEGLEVGMARVVPVLLPWPSHGRVASVMDEPPRDGWMITNWSAGRAGVFGVAVLVSGHLEVICQALMDATVTPLRRLDQWFQSGTMTGRRLPVLPRHTIFDAVDDELATLKALTQVIAARKDVQARLADSGRIRQLADRLSRCLLPWPSTREGFRRDTIDIITALRHAGFVHRFGRPLSSAEVTPLDEVVAGTRARLELNRYRVGRAVSDDTIASIARKVYWNVDPWPFEALL